MRVPQLRLAVLALVSGTALSACAYDMYGDPYGYGYGSGVSVGIGYGGGYGGYGGYGYGYPYSGYGYGGYGGYYGGYDPFGWYGDFYYPGSGIYVYDRYRRRHVWNDDQRRHWEGRRDRWQHHGDTTNTTQNWSGWDRSRWRGSNGGSWNRSDRQERSSLSTGRVRVRSSDGDSGRHHSRETQDRPQ